MRCNDYAWLHRVEALSRENVTIRSCVWYLPSARLTCLADLGFSFFIAGFASLMSSHDWGVSSSPIGRSGFEPVND